MRASFVGRLVAGNRLTVPRARTFFPSKYTWVIKREIGKWVRCVLRYNRTPFSSR